MRTLLVTGKPLPARWAAAFEGLGFNVINGSAVALSMLGVSPANSERELTESELALCLNGVEVYVYGGLEPASKPALKNADDLRYISFLGTGWSDPGCVDASAAAERHIRVSNTPHANALSVAEFALGAIIGASRHMFSMARETSEGGWNPVRGSDISGRTLGIVGLGAIGSSLARFARLGLGMEVFYYGPRPKTELEAQLGFRRKESLQDLLAAVDVLSIHAPATQETNGLIDLAILASATRPIVLVNCAAPEIVEGHALLGALQDGSVSAAVFDGKYPDGTLQQQLLALGPDRFVFFPRSAWLTDQSYERMATMSYDSVSAYVKSQPIPSLVLGPVD